MRISVKKLFHVCFLVWITYSVCYIRPYTYREGYTTAKVIKKMMILLNIRIDGDLQY